MSDISKISVIVPTRNRASFLPQLLELYRRQTWSNKELLILDDSEEEDTDFQTLTKSQSDVHYWHHKQRLSIGRKRNELIKKSTGDIIAHFDDDDYYAPNYLSWMHSEMHAKQADLVKLAGWFTLHKNSSTLGFWDTTDFQSHHQVFCGVEDVHIKQGCFSENALRSFLTGYGFSLFYKKNCWEESKFADRNIGEDSLFLENVLAIGKKANLVQDTAATCLHIIHDGNTSRCFPNYTLPSFLIYRLFDGYNVDQKRLTKESHTRSAWPSVTICTLTHNRERQLRQLQRYVEAQDYPHEKIEWLILDDSTSYTESLDLKSNSTIRIKYQRIKTRLSLGRKRNLAHRLCSGDFIIYMDDDDYYFPSRVSHAVETLTRTGREIAGSTSLIIYFTHDKTLWISGPFGNNHATAGTFAMTRSFSENNFYRNDANCNEEKDFLKNYSIPIAQLSPEKTMVCISHQSNTFDKKRMITNGETARMKKIRTEFKKEIKEFHLNYSNQD